ncbi:hypothetical protein V8C35DRAFT_313058 [Trichoderma chlorosporum]
MEDSHNHQVKRAQTSLNPQGQSTTYQVNVSRTKTRKWVEAKVQSYDGDDWGADEYDEESDHETPPPPPINPSLRTFSGTDLLHSRHNTPSPASSLSALPSLRTQAQQQQQQQPPAVSPTNQPPRIGVTSPVASDISTRSASESIASGHVVSPQPVAAFQGREGDGSLSLAGIAQLPSQTQPQQQVPGAYEVSRSPSFEQAMKPTATPPVVDRSVSPQISAPPPPADQPPPIIYSPDNYSRLHDNTDHETLALAPAISLSSGPDQFTISAPKPLSSEDRRDTWERDDDSSHSDHPESQGIRPDFESQAGIDRGRMSVSPKLPDLARMSAFGADLFASSASNNSIAKQAPIREDRDESSTTPATAAVESRWQPPAVPAEDEDHSEAPGGASLSQPNTLFPGRNIPVIPPLRTPSPQPPTAAPFDPQGTKVTPTEPLQPFRGEPLPDFEAPQLFQRVQTYGTDTSSPIKDSPLKENDVLSDEIMRTLSPSGATPAEVKLGDGPQLNPPEDRSAVRESSYTLMDYDSYWADTAEDSGHGHEDAPVPPTESLQAAAETLSASSAPSAQISSDTTSQPPAATTTFDTIFTPQQSQQSPSEEQRQEPQQQEDQQQSESSLRRRFSWEAEEQHRTPVTLAQTPIQAQPTSDDSTAPAVHLTGPSGQPFEPSVTNLSTESRSHSPVSQLSQAPTTAAGSGFGALALQTSIPFGSLPGQDSSLPEPPSPVSVSVISDKPSTTAREQARMSIADEKLFGDQGSASLVTGTPPPPSDSHPAVSSPTSAASVLAPQTPAPNPNPLAQTKAMNFRDIMALSTPAERIAKYTEAREALAARDSGLESWLLYLTTEHPELSASISGPGAQMTLRPNNNASLPVGSQPSTQQPYYQQYLNASSPSTSVPQSGGGGGGSGGGRSRLGGLSMPSQMSGSAFGHSGNQIGTKSKEFMHSAGKMGKGLLSKGKSKLRGSGDKVDTIPPDHPTPNKAQRRSTWRFSLEPRPREDDLAPHSNSDISTTPPQLPDPSPVSPLNAASGPGSAFPWSVSNNTPIPDLSAGNEPDDEHVRSDDLLIASSFFHGAYASAEQEENILLAGQRISDLNPDMVTPDDWVMVQHQGEQSRAQRMSMSIRAKAGSDDQARQQQSQPLNSSDAPKRNSSFIGLPPIRRGSTFGTKSKARRATERFSLDDEEGDDAVVAGDNADIDTAPLSPVGGFDASMYSSKAMAGADQGGRNEKVLPPQSVQGVPMGVGADAQFGQQHISNAGFHPQQQQRQQQQQPQQHYPDGPNSQFNQAAPMLGGIQKLPPAGPWVLEESHLTEPLHLTKKRSGTDFSQQDAYHGYNKELGLEFPAAPLPHAQGPPGRFRSDVPPSSARRYPELFSLPGQDPRQFGRGQGYPPPQMQGRQPREGVPAVRQQQGGPETDDRGRRRNSGIFKELGTRIARATSRERRSSNAEARPPSGQLHGDEVSETSVTTEDASDRRKKRASFLGFSGRPSSTDQGLRKEDDLGNQARQRDTRSAGAEPPADHREDRKRPLFGGAGQLKMGPGNFSRSSTSNSAFESASGPGGDGRDNGAPHKRRISDIAKASGIAGLFGRSRQDRSSLGAMPRQQTDDRRQNPQALDQRTTIPNLPPMQLPSLDFTSDPLDSMSNLGFGESFQSYSHEEQQQPQAVLEQPAQRQFGSSNAFSVGPMGPQTQQVSPLPAVHGGQERMAAPAGLASSQFNQLPQGIGRDSERQNPQTQLPPLATETLMPIQHIGGQRPPGIEGSITPPEPQVDSAMDEKTPRVQEFVFQEKLAALQLEGDNVSEEEILRSQTVSPDISIVSTSKTEERGPVQPQSDVSEHSEVVEGVLITPPPEVSLPPAADTETPDRSAVDHIMPPSVRSFPSNSSLHEKSDAKSIQHVGSSTQQIEESMTISREPSPQVAKSEISSKAATPVSQHQQLHSPVSETVKLPETQSADPLAIPRSQTEPESQQKPLGTTAQRQLPAPSSPLFAGPQPAQQQPVQRQQPMQQLQFGQQPQFGQQQQPGQQRQYVQQQQPVLQQHVQQPVQQLRTQYPPSVSVSNASIASEASTPVYQVQSGSQNLLAGLPGPFGRAFTQHPDAAAQQKDDQGSRWKGLKNRVSEQISQRSQPQQQQPQPQQQQLQQQQQQQSMSQGQNKTAAGEKLKGIKLLGALRRTSKQPEVNQTQGNAQSSASSRQLPSPMPQPHAQGYQPQQPGLQGPRPNAMPANSQYLQPSMQQPPNMPRAKTMPPGPPQQNAPPRDQTRSSEPRYESVPIPRGYTAVHGEGIAVPSPYHPNTRRQFGPLPPQQQLQQHLPHPHAQMQQQWQGGIPPPMSQQPQPSQFYGGPRMVQGPQNGGPGRMRAPSDSRSDYLDPRSPDSFNTQSSRHNRHNSQGSQNSRAEPPRPASGMGSNLGMSHPGSPQPSERGNLSVMDRPRSGSRSPAVSVGADQKPDLNPSPKPDGISDSSRASNLGIDVEKAQQLVEDDIYAATPKVVPNATADSGNPFAASPSANNLEAESSAVAAGKKVMPPANNGVMAELEDTEEARKRAIRLASQEEKIFYEPEDYEPKMSATSYPGQEWNPFGEPEFADWKEE